MAYIDELWRWLYGGRVSGKSGDKPLTKVQRKAIEDEIDIGTLRLMWERCRVGNPEDWRVLLRPSMGRTCQEYIHDRKQS